ncbi:S-layer homology domain-containing protein [Anoxybacterium hadale]|uniref:S-layer homology domain-containing protein n=1 Tax=Anoxybacterium hadale TaxID=3408580 RepID=UPI003B00E57D
MKRRLKRGLAILIALSMMLTLVPGSGMQNVYASGTDVRTDMLDLTEESVTYRTSGGLDSSADPRNTDITDTAEGWSWHYQSKTLTLEGINLITVETTALRLPENSTIVLAEDSDNTVTSTYDSDVVGEADCLGISCEGNLTIEGSGTLSVQSGNTANNYSLAIYTPNDLTISGGTINASGGAASSSSTGLYSLGTISITGGTITAEGSSEAGYSYGICSLANLSITGGTIDVSGGASSLSSVGLYCDGNMSITDGTITADGASDTGYSYGIYSVGNLSISDGIINTSGGDDTQYSMGICTTGDFSVTGGTVTAVGGVNADEVSYGILVSADLKKAITTFSGGTVSASGGDNTPYSIGICGAGDTTFTAGTIAATGNLAAEESHGIAVTAGSAIFSGSAVYAKSNADAPLAYAVFATLGITDEDMTVLQKDLESAYTQQVTKENVESFYTYLTDKGTIANDIRITEGSAAVSSKIVAGMMGAVLPGTDTITVTLAGSTFANLAQGEDVSVWFHNLPEGLSVTVGNVTSGTIELVFSGTPGTVSNETISITIPKGKLNTDSDIEVTKNSDTKFDITQEEPRKTILDLTANNVTYQKEGGGTGSGTPTSSSITNTAEGWRWYKNAEESYSENTLVLDGISLITANQIAVKLPAGSTIVLADDSENFIESIFDGTIATSGITCMGDLKIMGSTGSLRVTSGSSENSYSAAFDVTGGLSVLGGNLSADSGNAYGSSMGFYVGGPINISGGTITATGDNATSSYGIRSLSTITVTGGTVRATGSTASGGSYGIFAMNTATFSDGVVYAKSGAAPLSHAVYAVSGITDAGMTALQKDSNEDYALALTKIATNYTHDAAVATDIKIVETPVSYLLQVEGGGDGSTESGNYMPGTDISISAGTKIGYTFSGWTTSGGGVFDNSTLPNTTFTMPDSAVTITATWTEVQTPVSYLLQVEGGGDGSTESGDYAAGTVVSISAGTKNGYTFSGWTTSGGGVFDNRTLSNTTFTMPDSAVTITAAWIAITQPGGGSGRGGSSSSSQEKSDATVNGKAISAGTVKTEINSEGRTTTTFIVDAEKLNGILASEKSGVKIVLPFKDVDKGAVGRLTGEMVQAMEGKDATLIIKTDSSSYTLPASQINMKAVSKQLGANGSLADIIVSINISAPSNTMARVVENVSKEGGFTLVAPQLDYLVTCTYGGKTVNVTNFSDYVERTIAIPDGVNPSKITTGIVVSLDGTVHHVPTRVTVIDGKYYAVINSLTNSTYSVIWNPIEFADMSNHWAKAAGNNMGSRMVVNGVGNGNYEPDRNMTRAEFAAVMVRALGLAPEKGNSSFGDVASSQWYCGYIKTAAAFGIVKGYSDSAFGPSDTITREQAMTMIARAMKTTGLNAELANGEGSKLLEAYSDRAGVSAYAKDSIAQCIKTGVVSGRENNTLAPKALVTRAEVAAMAERLLQKSELI